MNCIHNKDEQEHCEECNCDKPQHTATPWKYEQKEKFGGCDIIGNEMNGYICTTSGNAIANAEFIVKACNNHDALMEALKMAHNSLRTFRDVPQKDQLWLYSDDETMLAIETALAQVEKG